MYTYWNSNLRMQSENGSFSQFEAFLIFKQLFYWVLAISTIVYEAGDLLEKGSTTVIYGSFTYIY